MDIKDRMIEAYERGECGYTDAYDYVREGMADAADHCRKQGKEDVKFDIPKSRRAKKDEKGVMDAV